jgi:purine-binding chemotaxis protein CheW
MQAQAMSERKTAKQATVAQTNKYLTFELAGETYGIGILKIREIIKVMEITSLPNASNSVRGVINLRGKIIPVVDLRMRFGVEAAEFTDRTCIVVVDLENEAGVRTLVGATVDSVSEVSQIPAGDVEPPPELGMAASDHHIQGMAKLKDKVVILLDIDKVLGIGLREIPQSLS